MTGVETNSGVVHLSATIYPEHAKLIEKILKKEYSKPVAHKSASEVVRRAIEHYAIFLGIKEE